MCYHDCRCAEENLIESDRRRVEEYKAKAKADERARDREAVRLANALVIALAPKFDELIAAIKTGHTPVCASTVEKSLTTEDILVAMERSTG